MRGRIDKCYLIKMRHQLMQISCVTLSQSFRLVAPFDYHSHVSNPVWYEVLEMALRVEVMLRVGYVRVMLGECVFLGWSVCYQV